LCVCDPRIGQVGCGYRDGNYGEVAGTRTTRRVAEHHRAFAWGRVCGPVAPVRRGRFIRRHTRAYTHTHTDSITTRGRRQPHTTLHTHTYSKQTQTRMSVGPKRTRQTGTEHLNKAEVSKAWQSAEVDADRAGTNQPSLSLSLPQACVLVMKMAMVMDLTRACGGCRDTARGAPTPQGGREGHVAVW
jgi:hypothetical protein